MANELKLAGYTTGATLTANIINDSLVIVGSASLMEASAEFYVGGMPPGLTANEYTILFYDGADVVGDGEINWSGSQEVVAGSNISNNFTFGGDLSGFIEGNEVIGFIENETLTGSVVVCE